MKALTIKIGDRSLKGKALRVKDALWVHLNGETFIYRPQIQGLKPKGRQGISSNVVTAPMPGKIVKLRCQEGDPVDDGQVVIVMEAMKMEYSLKTTKAGKVKRLLCQVGDQVALGQTLLEVE